jgi:hypothetical protein
VQVVVSVLIVVSVVLPIWGGVGLYRSASAAQKKFDEAPRPANGQGITIGQFDVLLLEAGASATKRKKSARRDLLLVGAGVIAGGAADLIATWF